MTPTPTEQVRSPHLLRRLLAVIFGLALVGGLTTACSSDDSGSNTGETSSDNAYPVTIDTTQGQVTIDKKPERVIVANGANAGNLLELGTVPIAVWSQLDAIKRDNPDVLEEIGEDKVFPDLWGSDGYNFEAIANLNPDLIYVTNSMLKSKDDFDRLNAIAPTVSQSGDGKLANWKDSFLSLAAAMGEEEKANTLISNTEKRFSEVGAKIPNIESKTYNYVAYTNFSKPLQYGNGEVLKLLGMTPGPKQDDANQGGISLENVSTLNADLLIVWPYPDELQEKFKALPQYSSLPAVKNESVFFVDQKTASLLIGSGVRDMNKLLDTLAPMLDSLK
ncbi:iron-siderophore ABC transporter substrate-binding protein [Corynebacterium provencense]|uniref:iron-siderophore ABC transporter substrate-binding protein n=1 Tax=Corynebacterium provencense TaxID=1737425 RepID=UPI00098FB6CD|nr:iron-siderophore ABC transporter substrate-binding protein [Corynebacterium provencense]